MRTHRQLARNGACPAVLRAFFALLLASSAFAQVQSLPPAGIRVPVWGTPGEALSPKSMSAEIDGAPAQVLDVKGPADDLMLIVVLDLTDDLAAVQQARDALISRIGQMPDNHFIAVMNAQNGLNVLSEPSGDRAAAAAAIRTQPVGGRAGLLNTIEQVAKMGSSIINRSGVRVAVLYLTDSSIDNYRENYTNDRVNNSDGGDLSRAFSDTIVRDRIQRMVQALGTEQAPLFISHLTYRNDRLNQAYQTGLISLSGATGGATTISRSVAEIPSAINELLDKIGAHYSVKVAVPTPHSRDVGVTLKADAGNPLIYRSNYLLD